jgi:hypothetical protein
MTAVLALALFAATLDVVSLPVASPDAHVFLAATQARRPARVCVLEGNRLSLYALDDAQQAVTVVLDPATGPVDIADVDGDGLSEVLCIAGDRILRYAIPQSGKAVPEVSGREIFSLQTQLSAASGRPFPYVLVVPWEGAPALALPTEQAFEIRRPDGALEQAFPVGDDAPQRVTYGRPFSYWAAAPPQVGSPGALELVVNRISSYEPVLPGDVLPVAPPQRVARSRGMLRAGDDQEDYARWLWFPLQKGGELRVFFALAPPRYSDTLLVVQKEPAAAAPTEHRKTTPAMRYPGIILAPDDDLPDLNGDGYTDILLWSTPEPGVSVDALTQAVLGRTWPLRVTAHLFDPNRQRYEAQPKQVLECRVPVAWFIGSQEEIPLHHVVVADFNGDGRTDIGGSYEEKRYTFWLSGEDSEASFSHVFDEAIESTVFAEDIRDDGKTVVGLRTQSAVHILQVPR